MKRAELATRLVTADPAEREALLLAHPSLADVELAYALKDICLEDWSAAPARAAGAAEALKALAHLPCNSENREIEAIALWIAGFAAVVAEGQLERAVKLLEDSAELFDSLSKPHTAASTQVIKLYALALLGRYDEAIECGLNARELFLEHSDLLAAGKIEHNIGNIYFRRDQYEEAEKFQSSARARFVVVNDAAQLTKIENSLALTLSQQHKIRGAEELYQQALTRAEAAQQLQPQAAIESSIGTLALYQGRYDRALDYLERSRRKYAELKMSHLSALTEQEIADAYLELNLIPEAVEIYERVTRTFVELGMRAEEARARAYHARALIVLGQTEEAHSLLGKGGELYAAEGNTVGVAVIKLTEAQLFYEEGNCGRARQAATLAESPLAAAGATRRLMFARWLHGEAARCEGLLDEAQQVLKATLTEAGTEEQPDIAARCLTSLGLLAVKAGDVVGAETSFKEAVALIEALRAPLPAEEFRTAFFADKLTPYNELVRLCLDGERTAEALGFVEQARARALADVIGGSPGLHTEARDSFETALFTQLESLRQELNYFYNQINRGVSGGVAPDQAALSKLNQEVRSRERKTLEVMRQLHHRESGVAGQGDLLQIGELQGQLGPDTALLEYATIDDELMAFVITSDGLEVVRDLGSHAEAVDELGRLRFQIDALRYGSAGVRRHMVELTRRVNRHLQALYDLLLRPLKTKFENRRLMIVPHKALHYVPFQALHDGEAHLIERCDVSYAPSAVVLQQCLRRPRGRLEKALLMGVADEQTPRVREEIEALAPLFPEAIALLNERATTAALQEFSPSVDILHLACHGQFRPDNPLFSSLRLGDGWLTVRDSYNLDLKCGLAVLSACETGVNKVAPGDELIGLARGFFSAGVPSLLLSLWTVDDGATAELMASFYKRLLAGERPAGALRGAQLEIMEKQPHPFFWSPFIIVGRP